MYIALSILFTVLVVSLMFMAEIRHCIIRIRDGLREKIGFDYYNDDYRNDGYEEKRK